MKRVKRRMKRVKLGPPLPSPPFSPLSPPRALPDAGWVTIAEAIAWVGFGRAEPLQRWDLELQFGLSLWPWYSPSMARQWLRLLARGAAIGGHPYSTGMTPDQRFRLLEALRELASRRLIAGLPSAEDPDQRLRDEATRLYHGWDEGRMAEATKAFQTATLASDAIRATIAEGAMPVYGVLAGREGAEVDSMPRQAVASAVCDAPVTLAPGGLYPFTPDDVARSSKLGPIAVDLFVPARALSSAFPRTPGEAPNLLAALAPGPELREADAVVAEQSAKPKPVRTGTAGCPTSMHLVRPEHRRRIVAGEAKDTLVGEATDLREWLERIHPEAPLPGLSALQNAIRHDHPEHLKWRPRMNRRG